MLPSVITGGLAVALMFSLTHSAARREDSSAPVLSWQTVTVILVGEVSFRLDRFAQLPVPGLDRAFGV